MSLPAGVDSQPVGLLPGHWNCRPSFSSRWVFQDFAANPHRPRSRVLLALFRLAQAGRYPFDKRPHLYSYVTSALYVIVSEWLLHIEIPVKTSVGPRLQIVHGYASVVNVDAVLGADVIIRQCVTIGNKGDGGASPRIGAGTSIGSGACLIGPINVGENARIGSNSVVLSDVPATSTAVGNPARIL